MQKKCIGNDSYHFLRNAGNRTAKWEPNQINRLTRLVLMTLSKGILDMKIACAQLEIAWESPGKNMTRLSSLLAGSILSPGALLVLPEMALTGFSMAVERTAEDATQTAASFYRNLAIQHKVTVVGGVTERSVSAPHLGRNEAVVIEPGGAETTRYCKTHPFSFGGESNHFEPGNRLVLFRWGGLTVCPLICYDLRFPEIFRSAVDNGAEMFVVIANWPTRRLEHWTTLLRARAIENQAYVVGVNRSGSDPKNEYPGRSMIIDPQGRTVAEAGPDETLLIAEIDPTAVNTWRAQFPALKDRRGPIAVSPIPTTLSQIPA